MASGDDVQWDRPGPGTWTWLGAHVANAPTPLWWRFNAAGLESGMEEAFGLFGAPLRTMRIRAVNGRVYSRLEPLVGGSRDMPPPPKPILWLASRLHPEFRRRDKAARRSIDTRAWRSEVRRWREELRPALIAKNLEFQAVDLAALDDEALGDHIARLLEHTRAGHHLHFRLHASDLGPLGMLLAAADEWGISSAEVALAMRGASPSSSAALEQLQAIARMLDAAGVTPRTLDDVRAAGPEVAEALDDYLRLYGWRIVTNYDIDGRALVEMPDAIVTAIRAAAEPRQAPHDDPVAALRDKVPASERPRFDELLTEAHHVYDLRDDNGPLTAEWPIGLLRRAVLDAGRRLAASGRLQRAEHAVELDIDELHSMLDGPGAPTADDIAARAERRVELSALPAPMTIGPEEPPPPVDALPRGLAEITRLVLHAVKAMDAPVDLPPLNGVGVGDAPYKGRARVVTEAEDALCAMEPGEVLVAPFTNPAYNTVLGIAGAVVVEEGGVLCHAAVMARELHIPAVVGARGALAEIRDGDMVEVDPVAGVVRVLSAAG